MNEPDTYAVRVPPFGRASIAVRRGARDAHELDADAPLFPSLPDTESTKKSNAGARFSVRRLRPGACTAIGSEPATRCEPNFERSGRFRDGCDPVFVCSATQYLDRLRCNRHAVRQGGRDARPTELDENVFVASVMDPDREGAARRIGNGRIKQDSLARVRGTNFYSGADGFESGYIHRGLQAIKKPPRRRHQMRNRHRIPAVTELAIGVGATLVRREYDGPGILRLRSSARPLIIHPSRRHHPSAHWRLKPLSCC